MTGFVVRTAHEADLDAIFEIAQATGHRESPEVFGSYQRHLMARGTLLVAERDGAVSGYGATVRIGSGSLATCMLADLFVHPSAHGRGCGRVLLSALWRDQPRRMTFSSLHPHALPLYTAFGLDAWWPLLYLSGDPAALPRPARWSVRAASPEQVGALELSWTGADRTADHRMWASWPMGAAYVATLDGRPAGAGTAAQTRAGPGVSIGHLAMDPSARSGQDAANAVIAVLTSMDPPCGQAGVCLPAPHPATRPLLAAGWRVDEFDLHMATQPDLVDPRRAVPSPALA